MDVEPSGQIQEREGEGSQRQPDDSDSQDLGVGDARKQPGGNGYRHGDGEQGAAEPQAQAELGAHETPDERVADLGLLLDLDAGAHHPCPAARGEHDAFPLGWVLSHRRGRWGNGTGAVGPG